MIELIDQLAQNFELTMPVLIGLTLFLLFSYFVIDSYAGGE